MIYNQDDEEDFLSDKKIGEVNDTSPQLRRRGGAYQEEKIQNAPKEQYDEDDQSYKKIIIVAAIVLVILIAIVGFIVAGLFKDEKTPTDKKTNTPTTQTTTNKGNSSNNSSTGNSSSSSNTSKPNNTSNSGISSTNETYDAYSIKIESVVSTKGGNFFNNNEKIKGDKAYVEYKQISGLKDKSKEEKINNKLKELSTSLYDKNYLGDKDTLFIDIHTKLSVNFNTLSYVVIKTYEDIDGNHKDEKVISYNIRLDTLEEISFEDLFVANANIKNMYSEYVKGKVYAFYYDPQYIYVYEKDLSETKIDMSKHFKDIAIYSKYKADGLFESSKTQKNVFTVLNSTVSTETKDRDFQQN